MTPRLVNKQTWEAPPGSLWYVVAEAAIQQKRKPNILGVQQAMNGQEEYAQNPNREPLLI